MNKLQIGRFRDQKQKKHWVVADAQLIKLEASR